MSAERSHISPTLCPESGQIRFMVLLGPARVEEGNLSAVKSPNSIRLLSKG
jgi:hypothetical protein